MGCIRVAFSRRFSAKKSPEAEPRQRQQGGAKGNSGLHPPAAPAQPPRTEGSTQRLQQHPAPRALPRGWGILPACSFPIPGAGFRAGMTLGAGLEAEQPGAGLAAARCACPAESKVTSACAQSPAEAGFPRLKCSTAACRVHAGGAPLSLCMGAPPQAYPSSRCPTQHRCGLSTHLLQGEEPRGAGTHLPRLGAPSGAPSAQILARFHRSPRYFGPLALVGGGENGTELLELGALGAEGLHTRVQSRARTWGGRSHAGGPRSHPDRALLVPGSPRPPRATTTPRHEEGARGGQDRIQGLGEGKRTEAPNFPHDRWVD